MLIAHRRMAWCLVPGVMALAFGTPASAETPEAEPNVTVRVVLIDDELQPRPVPRHALTVTPAAGEDGSRVVTGFDGVGAVRLAPGEYTATSEKPVSFQGHVYRWRVDFTVEDDRTLELILSVDNADTEVQGAPSPAGPVERAPTDAKMLFDRWRDSVFTIWGEVSRGSGFLVSRSGVVLTNYHVVQGSKWLAVQINPSTKVQAVVDAYDAEKDLATLRINPLVVEDLAPVHLDQDASEDTHPEEGDKVFAIGSPLSQQGIITEGIVSKVEQRAIISDVNINQGNSGGPMFDVHGRVIGVNTFRNLGTGGPGISGAVRIDEARGLIDRAAKSASVRPAPPARLLAVEPLERYPLDALKMAITRWSPERQDYEFDLDDYRIAFDTPVSTYGSQVYRESALYREKQKRMKDGEWAWDPFASFQNWREYIGKYRPVLAIRAAPELKEGFWSALGRGLVAASGNIPGPARMSFKADFSRLQLYCGPLEVEPIHPGRGIVTVDEWNWRVAVEDVQTIGSYIYPPDAIGPHCGRVRLVVHSEGKASPDQAVVPARVVQRVWEDFAPYRAHTRGQQPIEMLDVRREIGSERTDGGEFIVSSRSITVATEPEGAYVYVNGINAGTTTSGGLGVTLWRDTLPINIIKPGFAPVEGVVVVRESSDQPPQSSIRVRLLPPAGDSGHDGSITRVRSPYVRLRSEPPNAEVFMDGRSIGRTSDGGLLLQLGTGKTRIELRHSGMPSLVRSLVLEDEAATAVDEHEITFTFGESDVIRAREGRSHTVRLRSGYVRIRTGPAGAEVLKGDRSLGVVGHAGLLLLVAEGETKIEVRSPGLPTVTLRLLLEAHFAGSAEEHAVMVQLGAQPFGQDAEMKARVAAPTRTYSAHEESRLREALASPAPGRTRVRIVSEPVGAQVVVHGIPMGDTTEQGLLVYLTEGTTRVRIVAAGLPPAETDVVVVQGVEQLVGVSLRDE